MELITQLEDCTPRPGGIITVGTYDGIHLAHQTILKKVLRLAHESRVSSTVVTFDPHPRIVLRQEDRQPVELLTTIEEKISLFEKIGPDRVVIIPFTQEFSRTSPETFISEILHKKIGMGTLIIGYDHGFGRDRAGDRNSLELFVKKYGFNVEVVPPISNEFGKISSTNIRNYLKEGDITKATASLGRYYSIEGKVIPGDGRGRQLNYPTANIDVTGPAKCIPGNGVYIVKAEIDGSIVKGVMNIGVRPTFGERERVLETHFLDFDRELYGMTLGVCFVERIRAERTFDSPALLKKQIEKDVGIARAFFDSCTDTEKNEKLTIRN